MDTYLGFTFCVKNERAMRHKISLAGKNLDHLRFLAKAGQFNSKTISEPT